MFIMDTFFIPLLMAAPPAGPEAAGPAGFLTSIIPFAAIIGIFYFLIIRPQSKKRKETDKMQSSLKKGDRIVTIGGIYGTISNVRESTVIIKVDENVKMEFLRSAISSVITSGKEDKSIEDNRDKSEGQSLETGD